MQCVTDNIAGQVVEQVPQVIMFLREEVFESHGLTAIAVVDRMRGLFMDMDYFGFGDVADGIPLCHDAMRPFQVFQTGQGFIVMETLPQRAADGGIGIVTERVRLVRLRLSGYQW